MNKKQLIFIVGLFFIMLCIVVIIYIYVLQEPKAQYVETKNQQLNNIRLQLQELKEDLGRQGLYKCCIRNDCNWCAIYMGHCNCEVLVIREGNEKSCPECAAAWNRKQGKIPGITPGAIQVTTFGIYGYEKDGQHYHPADNNNNENEESETEKIDDHEHMPH